MIIHGDCLDVLKTIEPAKALFADPPDNLGMKYLGYDDKMDDQDYYDWLRLLIMFALPKCQVFWLTYYPKHDLEISSILLHIIKTFYPEFKVDKFIWRFTFSQYSDFDCSYGYRPIARIKRDDCVLYPNEIREHSQRYMLGDSRTGGQRDDPRRVPDNVWSIPRVVGNSPERCAWMPTQIPLRLYERIIKFSIKDQEELIDLFAGSGGAIVAGQRCDRIVHGIELDYTTCLHIKNRTGTNIIQGMSCKS